MHQGKCIMHHTQVDIMSCMQVDIMSTCVCVCLSSSVHLVPEAEMSWDMLPWPSLQNEPRNMLVHHPIPAMSLSCFDQVQEWCPPLPRTHFGGTGP